MRVLVAAVIAFVFAMFSALSFFSGQTDTGMVTGAGAWLLVWWAGHHLKREG